MQNLERSHNSNNVKEENTGLIILAAGGSNRLGRLKQLLTYEGNTLLSLAICTARDCKAETVVVVLGAHADDMLSETAWYNVHTAVNADWQKGVASSIKCGIAKLLEADPNIKGTVIMLCDQPFVTPQLLDKLIANGMHSGFPISASTYGEVTGVPAWFSMSVFSELMELEGDTGARAVIRRHRHETAAVSFPEGLMDIDTEMDYKALTSGKMLQIN